METTHTDTPPRTGRALWAATRPFAAEDPRRSWGYVGASLLVLATAITLAAVAPWWPVRVVAGIVEGLTLLRIFTHYHDHMHGSLLRRSPAAKALFAVLGVLMIAPPRFWADSHNFHHGHTGRLGAPPTGTYALWSVERWREASFRERLAYRLERNPMTMIFGYVTVFFVGMCVSPFVKNPRRYASSAIAGVVHLGLGAALAYTLGFGALVTAMLLPFFIACAIGSYLFYAQHNAEGVAMRGDDWNHADAAVEASTLLATGPVMRWFTGDIGFHHVHHLNVKIPFYRLEEAMAAIPELQSPVVTRLRLGEIASCLRLFLWDAEQGRMVSLRDVTGEARATEETEAGGLPSLDLSR